MSEKIFVEVGDDLLEVPRKGDLVEVLHPRDEITRQGICLHTNVNFHLKGLRFPIVEVMVDGGIYLLPISQVRIVQNV